MVSKAGLFFIVMLLGFCSCKNKNYTSVFDYDFTTKSDLKKYGFESMREDNRKMKQRMKDNGFPNPAFIPDEEVRENWLIKRIGDTVLHYRFHKDVLAQEIIEIRLNNSDSAEVFQNLVKKGFVVGLGNNIAENSIYDSTMQKTYWVNVTNKYISLFRYFGPDGSEIKENFQVIEPPGVTEVH